MHSVSVVAAIDARPAPLIAVEDSITPPLIVDRPAPAKQEDLFSDGKE
jgi:hypothetical protein